MDYIVNIGKADATLHQMQVENANEASVYNRRLAMAKAEEVDVTRQIQTLQDEIATSPYNASLRVQAALLEDIAGLRKRDEEALILRITRKWRMRRYSRF